MGSMLDFNQYTNHKSRLFFSHRTFKAKSFGAAYPQPSSVHSDLAAGLLLPLPPLHQVEAVVDGQGHVPLADGGDDGAGQQVGLSVQGHLHAVGQHQSQRAVQADEVAVPHLI